MKSKKNTFKNQSIDIFKEFIRNESRPNILVVGKASMPKTYYPVNADKKEVIKNERV